MLGGKLFHCHLASKWYTFRVSFTDIALKMMRNHFMIEGIVK
jgi:hypothetical protein